MGKLEEKSGLETAKIVLVVFLLNFQGFCHRTSWHYSPMYSCWSHPQPVHHRDEKKKRLVRKIDKCVRSPKASECLESKVAKLMRSRRALGFLRHEFWFQFGNYLVRVCVLFFLVLTVLTSTLHERYFLYKTDVKCSMNFLAWISVLWQS